jgi:hypothetical protein
MNISNRILQVFVIIFMCASCAPIPVRYYYLESNSGEAIYSPCFINEDIPNRIRFSQQGIRISTALEQLKGKKYIAIYIEVPEGKTVKLKSTTVQVFWSENNRPDKAAFRKISLADKILIYKPATQEHIFDTNEPMVGKRIKSEWGERDKSYSLAAYLDIPDADEFHVILPQLTVNKALVTLPELRFHRKWIMVLVNLIGELHC